MDDKEEGTAVQAEDVDIGFESDSSDSVSEERSSSSSSEDDDDNDATAGGAGKQEEEEYDSEEEEEEEEDPEAREPDPKEKNTMRHMIERFARTALTKDYREASHLINVDHAVDFRVDIVKSIEAVVDRLSKDLAITMMQGDGMAVVRGPLPYGKRVDIDVGAWNSSLEMHGPYGRFSLTRRRVSRKRGRGVAVIMHRIIYTRMTAPPSSMPLPKPVPPSSSVPTVQQASSLVANPSMMRLGKQAFSAETALGRRPERRLANNNGVLPSSSSSSSARSKEKTSFDDPPTQSRIVMAVVAGQYQRWPRVAPADSDVLQTVVELSNPQCVSSSRMAPRGVWEHLVKARAEVVVCEAASSSSSLPEDPAVMTAVAGFVMDRAWQQQDKTPGRVMVLDRRQRRGKSVDGSIDDLMDLVVRAVGSGAGIEAVPHMEVGRVVLRKGQRGGGIFYIGGFSIEATTTGDDDDDAEEESASAVVVYTITYTPFGARRTKDSYIRYMLNMKQTPYIIG